MTHTSSSATGTVLSVRPPTSLRRALINALTIQSVAVLALTLAVMVAGAGIRQRLTLAMGLILVVALAWVLARHLASRMERGGPHVPLGEAGEQASHHGKTPASDGDLAEPTQLLAEVTSDLPLPLFITDSRGRIARHSKAALSLAAPGCESLTGQPMEHILSPLSTPEQRSKLQRMLLDGRMWHGELTREAAGGIALLDVTAIPVSGDARGPRAVVYAMVDVTEVRQLQNLVIDMERMSTRGRMAGEIAHEINNFLTILGGNLDILPMLMASGDSVKVSQKFTAMKQALEKIARFSDGLMGCRDNDSEPSLCDVHKLSESLLAFLKPQNRYDGVALSVEGSPDVPKIMAKVGLVQQVLINLLNNAADAARQARGDQARIDVFVRRLANPERVAISVKDNGPGLSEAVAARIFRERYSDKPGGHGLGLLNCHRIAQAHGGTLGVENRPGEGATFTLTLPIHLEKPVTAPRSSRVAAGV